MTVIPESQLNLTRCRRQVSNAFATSDWESVQSRDLSLMSALNQAADDPARDMATLLQELKQIVGLYREMVGECELQVRTLAVDEPSLADSVKPVAPGQDF